MDNARIENGNIVFPASYGRGEDIVFPIELLEAISKLGVGVHSIAEALMFYGITKDAPAFAWKTPESLVGVDLTGWDIFYYEANYEDSRWNSVWLTKGVKLDASYENSDRFVSIDWDGEDSSNGFYTGEVLLVVKLTDEDFAARVKQEEINALEREAHAARWAARVAAESQEKLDNPDPIDNVLDAWEQELLNPDTFKEDE